MKRLMFSLFFLAFNLANAQHANLFLGNDYSTNFNHLIYSNDANYQTSFKPLIKSDLNFNTDSILENNFSYNYQYWLLKKMFSEHLIIMNGDDYKVSASPIINFSIGKESIDGLGTFVNTRGIVVQGDLGKTISFYTSFAENQAIFPNYFDAFIRKNKIVPGQGYARDFKEIGFDYAMSSGHVTYRANKMFAVQFGHGKHFIGDGYRSLLLSDNTFNYPFLRIQTTFGKVQYTNLYTEFMDINYFTTHSVDNKDQMGYPKKYMSSHYLSLNATKRFSLSLYEAVVWRMNHAPGSSGFDVNYLNPIAMLRPIEFSVNSPDNVLVGINTKYKFPFSSYLYGQIILDEFSLTDLRQDNGFWANKYGYQLGFKMFDAFKIESLTLQTEYNLVRPYTYAHHNPEQNYAHYNQPLAHPLGANFSEMLFLANYKWKRFAINGKLIFSKYGGKIKDDPTSYGNDLFMSTGNYASEEGLVGMGSGRPSDIGIDMYQGNLTEISYSSLNVSYVVNPKTNLKINIGITIRDEVNEEAEMQTNFINFGLVTDLSNHYYDF
tara:strand:- start:1238 stop:2881 length:1644 start_codon:yes stop_codon:yes gene_type:complete